MGLLNKGITLIHFDETYYAQNQLQHCCIHDDLDFQQMEHVNLYCEQDSLNVLSNHLQERSQKGITFIGNGNYHYVSYLLLKEIKKPFTLILFDNHPDLIMDQAQDKGMLSCGSWVSFALEEVPMLEKVIIIGPTTTIPQQPTDSRVVIFPFDASHHYSLKSILSAIHTKTVYISIDKDVLNTAEVTTNWDQGVMDIETLTHYLESIIQIQEVEGVDICGETSVSPFQTLLPNYQTIIKKNETANLRILQEVLKDSDTQIQGA